MNTQKRLNEAIRKAKEGQFNIITQDGIIEFRFRNKQDDLPDIDGAEVYLFAFIGIKTANKQVYVYDTEISKLTLHGKSYSERHLKLFIKALSVLENPAFFE